MKRKGTSSFKQVFHNGRRIRGLWSRNARFYAQMSVETGGLKRVTKMVLEARTAPKAIDEMAALKRQRDKGTLEKITHAPKLTDAIAEYKASATLMSKSSSSLKNESTYLGLWQEHLGEMRVDKIRKQHILAVRDRITSEGKLSALRSSKASNRTANLYVQGLRQVLKFQEERGRVAVVPKIYALKLPPGRRRELIDVQGDLPAEVVRRGCWAAQGDYWGGRQEQEPPTARH